MLDVLKRYINSSFSHFLSLTKIDYFFIPIIIMSTISNLPIAHTSYSTRNSSDSLVHSPNVEAPVAREPTASDQSSTTSVLGRISISLTIICFQAPLLNLFSYGNNSFLDTTSLSSIALLSGYSVLASAQLLFLVTKKPIDIYEIMVYAFVLAAAVIVTALMYHENYLLGVDGMKNYILNLVGLSISAVDVVYEMFKERHRSYAAN
jgi:hypothetical protein